MENIVQTQKVLKSKSEVLPDLEDALRDAMQRFKGADKARQQKHKADELKKELAWWEIELEKQGRLVESQRIHQRTMFDLEMIKAMGYCHGIENYSRHFTGRLPGEPPPTLLDYFPRDYLMFIDESHQTVPQLRGMYAGDRSRKEVLVEYGFRMPSAEHGDRYRAFFDRAPGGRFASRKDAVPLWPTAAHQTPGYQHA